MRPLWWLKGACLAAGLTLFESVSVFAGEIPLKLTGEDVGNGYRYEAEGIGGFTVNGLNNETVPAEAITLDPGCRAQLFLNGEPAQFSDVVIENGSYEMRLYAEGGNGEDYAVYYFTVENNYEDMIGSAADLEMVESPPLKGGYDGEREMFSYELPDGKKFYMSCPLGAISPYRVSLELEDGLSAYMVIQNGEKQKAPDELSFSREGDYLVAVLDQDFSAANTGYRVFIQFRLLEEGHPQNLSLRNAPQGMEILEAYQDGTPILPESPGYLRLKEDGEYEIWYGSKENPEFSWRERLVRDTCPPSLVFSKPVDKKRVPVPVDFKPAEAGCEIRLWLNGVEVELKKPRAAQSGSYRMAVTDAAGNEREYRFQLYQEQQFFDKKMVILLACGGVLLAGAMFHWRRHMRVL